jgi:molybdate transport system substrate-binding protein
MTRVRAFTVVAAVSSALFCGCGSGSAPLSSTPSAEVRNPWAAGAVSVFAASSLQVAFTEIGEQFKRENPGSSVLFTFAGSSDLVQQLVDGAHADVLAVGDRRRDDFAQADLSSGVPVTFALNALTIVVPPGNPKAITSFQDLAAPGVAVAVCGPQSACGGATRRVEQSTGVTLTPVSEAPSGADVLDKVVGGQADAGVVYATDAASAGDKVAEVRFRESSSAITGYEITALKQSRQHALALKFVDLVTGWTGQTLLGKTGFLMP